MVVRNLHRREFIGNATRSLFLIILSVMYLNCNGQTASAQSEIPKEVSKWIALKPPQIRSERWTAATYSHYSWIVSGKNGNVIASYTNTVKRPENRPPFQVGVSKTLRGNIQSIQVKNGYLVGRDAGEWGGNLQWFSMDGKEHYEVSKEQVVGFIQTKNELYAFSGLAHMGYEFGHILRLSKVNDHWKSKLFVDIKHAPRAFLVEKDGSLLVVTNKTLMRIKKNKQVETLIAKAFWWSLYPISVLETSSGETYVGMRHGVARVHKDQSKYIVEWLLPNKDFVNAKSPF